MSDLILRVNVDDYEVWKKTHDAFAEKRRTFGLVDQGTYQDVDDPHKAVVILSAESLDRAFEWFRSPEFQEASKTVGLRGPRDIWVAERR
jgi:uncharacterized protein (DUF1330 family)